jgi:hypothetical protein
MSSFIRGCRYLAAGVFPLLVLAFATAVYDSPQHAQSAGSSPDLALDVKFKGSDTTTRAIRNESKVLSRIVVDSTAEREKVKQIGAIVQDYGSFVIVARDKAVEAKNYGLDEQVLQTTVNLPGSKFDPLKDAPEGSLRLGKAATAKGKGYYILQFGASPTDEWLKSIRNAGVEVLQYIPHQAYFVYGDDESIARIADHSRVRWIGRYQPEQKLSRALRQQLEAARNGKTAAHGISPLEYTKNDTALFDIAVFERADLDAFTSQLRQTFGRGLLRMSRLQNNFFNVVRAELAVNDIEAVAALPDVIAIEAYSRTSNEDERSNQILAGNFINATTLLGPGYQPLNQFGADGTNVTVSVVDDGVGIPGEGGFYITTNNAVNGPLHGAPGTAFGHGHFNATIIAGWTPFGPLDSLFYNYALGVAPKANIVSIPRNRTGYTGTDVEVYDDSVSMPGPNGVHATISNNSWGQGTNGNVYNLLAAQFDGFVRDSSTDPGVDPLTLVFSAGNEGLNAPGANGLTQPKVAKNVIAVGNSEGLRIDLGGANADNMDDIAADSSRGPAADGRIKPDLVAPGTAITGGRSGTDSLKGNLDAFHRWSSGTSHSAAHISGMAALFTHWWTSANFGDNPSPSLIRAALINSARDLNGQNSSGSVPNGTEGWGRPNLKSLLNTGVGMKYIDEQVPLEQPGPGFVLQGSVADGTKPLRITVAWTDPPGVADPALVNDLDLIVTVGGTVYKGNVFSNGVSTTGGVADNRNNTESVFFPAGIPSGTGLSIEVRPTALNGDGILLNGDATDQNYSLVVYNWSGLVGPTFYQLAGRVVSADSRGIGMTKVRITDSQGIAREVRTNPLGYFRFQSVPGGQTYTVNIAAKRYTFVQQNLSVTGNMTNLIFRAEPGAP